MLAEVNQGDLKKLGALIEAGKVRPVIDRTYSLGEVPEAIRYLEAGHARGKVIVSVRPGDAILADENGVLVLDLPIEEADEFRNMLAVRGIDTILLLSPTTTDERLRRAAALGSGFLYAISRLGVTGARDRIADGAHDMVDRIRRVSDLPVALGFGISKPEHVREVGQWADAAVVGSALVLFAAKVIPAWRRSTSTSTTLFAPSASR